MKKLIVFLPLYVAVLMSGCISHNANTDSAPLQVRLIANELKADMQVGEKISGQGKAVYLFYWIPLPGTSNNYAKGVLYDGSVITNGAIYPHTAQDVPFFSFFQASGSRAVEAATYDAVTKSNADVIIAPRYEVDKQDYFIFQLEEAKVQGYKGTIKNIH
ncbi:MAG: hypothetical protein L0H94_11890 [Nitrospira sp.]|nr:hypothetical protein [Nitrospira sp.]